MRSYWIRILAGAFGIFAVGMIGVTIVRGGIAKVSSVMASSDPITIPLSFVPFALEGERLGKLEQVVILRDAPRQVRSVELEVNLADSLLAQGLGGCRLAANFESDPDSGDGGIHIRASRNTKDAFFCLPGDSTPPEFVEFGEAVFQPGEIRVPLYVQQELVKELQSIAADSSSAELAEDQADSLTELAEIKSDSAVQAAIRSADSLGRAGRRLGDSLRAAALRHADSIRAETGRMADSLEGR
jgi:hypothetical protein